VKLEILLIVQRKLEVIPMACKEQTSPDLNFWSPKVVYYGANVINWLASTRIEMLTMNETIISD
jgi:hypothetical protein